MSAKKIVIASSKGGVGKSTVTANLSDALSKQGKRVLMLDCDFGMRCLDILTGVENDVVYDLGDAAEGLVGIEDVFVEIPSHPGLLLCAAPFGADKEPDREKFYELLKDAEEKINPDYIIIDTPGGMSDSLKYSAPVCDTALIVSTQAPSAIRAADRTYMYLAGCGAENIKLIINKYDLDMVLSGTQPGIISIIDKTHVRLIGVVPSDEVLAGSEEYGMLLSETSNINLKSAFENIAGRILGRNIPLFTGFKKFNVKKALTE